MRTLGLREGSRRGGPRRWWLLAVVCAFVLGGIPSGALATGGDGQLQVLVMGDSYSAGNGAGDYYGAKGCRRSTSNYGNVFAAAVRSAPFNQPTSVTTVACSGDTTKEITQRKSGRAPQTDSVDGSYDLITLTIGGNDLKFDKIVKFCLIARFRDGANCGPLLTNAETQLTNGTVETKIIDALIAIRAKADPKATIVLLGYPYLEGDPDYTLRSGHGGNTFIKVGKRLRAVGDLGDKVQSRIIGRLNATPGARMLFVRTKGLFKGHELFAKKNNADRWFIQPFVDAGLIKKDLFYHPNRTGWRKEGLLLSRTPGVPVRDPVVVPAQVVDFHDACNTAIGCLASEPPEWLPDRTPRQGFGVRFSGLVWTGWGQPQASARGTMRSCVQSDCAETQAEIEVSSLGPNANGPAIYRCMRFVSTGGVPELEGSTTNIGADIDSPVRC